jgi:hypothetical protein
MINKMYEHIMEHIRSMPSPESTVVLGGSHQREWNRAVEAFRKQILLWDYSTEPFSRKGSEQQYVLAKDFKDFYNNFDDNWYIEELSYEIMNEYEEWVVEDTELLDFNDLGYVVYCGPAEKALPRTEIPMKDFYKGHK